MSCISHLATVALLIFAEADAFAKTRAEREADLYRQTGGLVRRPGTGAGRFVFVNAQGCRHGDLLAESAALLERDLAVEIVVTNGTFSLARPRVFGEATLYFVRDEALPTLLAAPEDRWVAVNTAHLGGADVKPAFLHARTKKEISRGLALLGGAFRSQFERTVTDCVTEPRQLDRIAEAALPFDVCVRIQSYVKGLGIRPYGRATYLDACYEGWAPQPTNEFQRAIWNKVHKIPDRPLTIEYDPKKDR